MNSKILIMVLLGGLASCKCNSSSDRYQLVSSSDGRVYRLDKKTGEIDLVENTGFKKIESENSIIINRDAIDAELKRRGVK